MPEALTEPPRLTDGDILMLTSAAEQRIETGEDGIDYLDGYSLPPSNCEVWEPRMIKGTITTVLWKGDKLTGFTQEEFERPSTITNRTVRQSNIRMIAQGKSPLYIKWEEVAYPPDAYRRPSISERIKEWKGKLLETLWLSQP